MIKTPRLRFGDKLAHGAVWAGWAVLCVFGLARTLPRARRETLFAITAAGAAALGFLDEMRQRIVPGRSCDATDWVADFLGAALAAFVTAKFLEWARHGGWPWAPGGALSVAAARRVPPASARTRAARRARPRRGETPRTREGRR